LTIIEGSQQQVPPSFRRINPKRFFLVVDASTNPVQVGIPEAEGWQCLARVEEQALEGLFLATENILQDSKKGDFSGQLGILLRRTWLDPWASD
jgi:hypothetical protein